MTNTTKLVNIRLTQKELINVINFNEENNDTTIELIRVIMNSCYRGMDIVYDRSCQWFAHKLSVRNPYYNEENIIPLKYIKSIDDLKSYQRQVIENILDKKSILPMNIKKKF